MEAEEQISWDLGVSGLRPLASGVGHQLTVSTQHTRVFHKAKLFGMGLGSAGAMEMPTSQGQGGS